MQYIIKRKNDGKYVSSCSLTVAAPAFARRFNSMKQAYNYMYKCGLKTKQADIIGYAAETGGWASRNAIREACRSAHKEMI